MSKRGKIKTQVKVPVVPKLLVRAIVEGAKVKALGGNDSQVRFVQEAAGKGYARKVAIYGTDKATGNVQVAMETEFEDDGGGEVAVDLNSPSLVDDYDTAIGATIRYGREEVERQGLKAEVRVTFRDDIYRDEAEYRRVQNELGSCAAAPPTAGAGHELRELVKIRPERDGGTQTSWLRRFKRRD